MRSGNSQEQKGKYMYMGGLEPSCLLSTWVCLTELQMDKIPRKRQGSGVVGSDHLIWQPQQLQLNPFITEVILKWAWGGEPEIQAFCNLAVHMQVATRICMKGQGRDFIERPCIWEVSIRNLCTNHCRWSREHLLFYPKRELLGLLLAGNRPSTVNFLAP